MGAAQPAHTVLLLFTTALYISTTIVAAENPSVHLQRADEELSDFVHHLDQDDDQQLLLLKRETRNAEDEKRRKKNGKIRKQKQDENISDEKPKKKDIKRGRTADKQKKNKSKSSKNKTKAFGRWA